MRVEEKLRHGEEHLGKKRKKPLASGGLAPSPYYNRKYGYFLVLTKFAEEFKHLKI